MNDRTSKVNKGNLSFDRKGLIFEAYNIKGIDAKSCKTIFFDWAIDLDIETDQKHAISQLLEEYGSRYPSHPMTNLLLSGLNSLDQKEKKKRRRNSSPVTL
jgi:hypothetical protein